jgi:hypothetical protein
MSVVMSSYQIGRPSKVDVATVIDNLRVFTILRLTSLYLRSFEGIRKPLVCHDAMTPVRRD